MKTEPTIPLRVMLATQAPPMPDDMCQAGAFNVSNKHEREAWFTLLAIWQNDYADAILSEYSKRQAKRERQGIY